MDPAIKRTRTFIQRKLLSWPVLWIEFSLHHVHHWPNQKQRIMICFSLLWVGLIWITDMKIPQDVLKMISGHVVAKSGMLRMLSLFQNCSREFFLRIPTTIRWATNTFISSGLVSSQLFSHAQGFLPTPSLSNSIGSFSPLSFACLSFVWTYLLVFSLSIVHILSSKIYQKLHLECIHLNPCSFNRISQIYICLGGPVSSSSLTQPFFSSSGYTLSFG